MFDALIEQIKETEGITEQLKEENQIEWIRRMNNIIECVTETIYSDVIFV